jgi:hypothetical protein
MRYISDKNCTGNQNTHFVFSSFFFFENRTVYEKKWKNIVEGGRPQMPIWRVRIACWIPKAHSGCVILITFPLQQRSPERASVSRYTYIVCLVVFNEIEGNIYLILSE